MVVMVLAIELSTSSGSIRVALSNIAVASATLSYVITSWTSLETSIGALARLRQFESDAPSEHLAQETDDPTDWPSGESIEINDLTISYRLGLDPVVRGLNLTIPPRANIGICGRLGSGKSSLILSFLRLTEIVSGTISIDNIDISHISREIIRRRLSILPQEPMIFSGSIRSNIDPFQVHTDEAITSALSKIGMQEWFISLRASLDTLIQKDKLSSGQQQLLSFARILLNPSKVLLLDEATSMMDVKTEAKITKLVHEEFRDSIVISVAHRLQTIVDFDLVLVMDQGVVIESGNPSDLLKKNHSAFKDLWMKQSTDDIRTAESISDHMS
ncbi:hypothetical protein N7495_000868 [Penicillium taxi]|uniref:uncharacterized protein n=1 Tax=Penicillium taxi TaxID=168475 RepID=UPI002544E69F|nr:uncharacterized protein N7495_000868 [Penicillium taxi]KAJ5908186.1 hypothetical protein N7495_000868 [Penicillium taxi]